VSVGIGGKKQQQKERVLTREKGRQIQCCKWTWRW
jgi:hypothetical protein